MNNKFKREIHVGGGERLLSLLGNFDENLNAIITETGAEAYANGETIVISGEEAAVELTVTVINKLLEIIDAGERIDKSRIIYCVELARDGQADDIGKITSGVIAVTSRGKPIKCKTFGQKVYIDEIKKNTVVFGVGPAGTGKT